MQALKLQAHIGKNHRLEIDLPEDTPEGMAEVIVSFPPAEVKNLDEEHCQYLKDFFQRLDASDRPRLTKAEIDRYIEEERDSWGD